MGLEGEVDHLAMTFVASSTPSSGGQKTKRTWKSEEPPSHVGLRDAYVTLPPRSGELMPFSSMHGTVTKIDDIVIVKQASVNSNGLKSCKACFLNKME